MGGAVSGKVCSKNNTEEAAHCDMDVISDLIHGHQTERKNNKTTRTDEHYSE